MPHSSQSETAPLMRPLLGLVGAALALPVLDAFLRPLCISLQPQLPWIDPVATSHALGALVLVLALWMIGISPLPGLRLAAAAGRERTALDESSRILFLVVGLVPAVAAIVAFGKAMAIGLPLSPHPWFWLATALIIGLTEEYAVRGPLFEALAGIGPRAAIYGSAAIFALLHLGNFRGAPDAFAVIDQISGALMTGLCWGFMRWRWRTVWLAAAIHGFLDFVPFVLANAAAPVVHLAASPNLHQTHIGHIGLNLAEALFLGGIVWLLRPGKARIGTAPVAA
jgi:membrane protease YdiL (CAAX protease family)